MHYITNNTNSWQEKTGYSKKILATPETIGIQGSQLQMVKIAAGQSAASHYHAQQTEVFYFLSDVGYWIVNDQEIRPNIGDTLIIHPQDKHTVINPSNQDYVYLAFKGNYVADDLIWD